MNKLLLILFCMLPFVAFCQEESDEGIRENPEVEGASVDPMRIGVADYSAYPFLNLSANRIQTNGADWSALRRRFDQCDDTVISIVHIGDSHVQAEGNTSRTRALLQNRFGSAGRGLIIPFRLAGTNQPFDYSITSSSSFSVAKLLKHPWPHAMGFTGVSLQPETRKFNFSIEVKDNTDYSPDFDIVKMYCHGGKPSLIAAKNKEGHPALYSEYAEADTVTVFLFEPVTHISLFFESPEPCQIFGFKLENQMVGVEYSAIGNNGATYSSYNAIGTLGHDLQALSPNLVVIALGTNEAFGKVTTEALTESIDKMVKDIQTFNPQAQILLVTPSECQRSKYVRSGKKRRRTKTYQVNDNIPRLRNAILDYGKEHDIATYDWYAVAGGAGSSSKWISHKLMGADRIHNTWTGYALQGSLFYDALLKEL